MKILSLILILFGITLSSQAQRNVEGTLEHQSRQRRFVLHLPPTYNSIDQVPLVIVLHGGSGDANVVQNFTRMNEVSDDNSFIVAYPEGIAPTNIGGFSWADGRGTTADDLGIDDVGFVDKLIDRVNADYAIRSDQIYLCGFSNGGFLTQKIACEMPNKFAAMASLGSTQDEILNMNCNPDRPIPTLILTGTADPLVPYNGGPMNNVEPEIISSNDLIQFWAENNNCQTELDSVNLPDIVIDDNSTVTAFEFTDCDCDANVKHLRINGGGHTWPGVEIANLELTAGETNEDIQASQELWNFFQRFILCPELVTSIDDELFHPIELKIFPNPTSKQLFIQTNQFMRKIQIANAFGQIIQEYELHTNSLELDLDSLPSGVFILRILDQQGRYFSRRIRKP